MSAVADVPAPPSNWRQRIVCFLPFIVPVVVVATFVVFYQGFLFCSSEHPCAPFTSDQIRAAVITTDPARVSAYVARASWTLINGVHLLACLLAIITAAFVIDHALSDYDPKVRWTVILITVAAALDISLGVSLWSINDIFSPAQQLHRATIGDALPGIGKFNRFAEALSLTAALSLAVAGCAILWQRDPNTGQDAESLKRRMNLLKPVLYVGAVAFVLAVLRLSATHSWALSYLPSENELGKAFNSLTMGIVGTMGTTYTLFIAGVYLPTFLILRSRLKEVDPALPDTTGWMQLLTRVMALIGPLLAGPLGAALIALVKSLGGTV